MKVLWIAFAFALCTGCISAEFHSKTGQTFPSLTRHAVIVEGDEAAALWAAGAEVIGSISSEGLTTSHASDLTEKAARVSAEHGGTHVLLTEIGAQTYTYEHPATATKQCIEDDRGYACQKTYQPAYTTESSRPTAEYRVLRVTPDRWGQLPSALRPAAL